LSIQYKNNTIDYHNYYTLKNNTIVLNNNLVISIINQPKKQI